MSELPKSTTYYGFDIDLAQVPPKQWLPPNLTFHKLDLDDDIPPELGGTFDIINVRLLMLVVKGNDPTQILLKLQRLLKPGGWLQWTEAENTTQESRYITASPNLSSTAMQSLYDKTVPTDPRLRPTWPAKLADFFDAANFVNVEADTRVIEEFLPWLAFSTDTTISLYPELIAKMAPGSHRDEMERLYGLAVEEAWKGAAWTSSRINVVGQKVNESQ